MFIAFLSYRNRILGVQLFKYRVEGFRIEAFTSTIPSIPIILSIPILQRM